jgi:hypothetical protein
MIGKTTRQGLGKAANGFFGRHRRYDVPVRRNRSRPFKIILEAA